MFIKQDNFIENMIECKDVFEKLYGSIKYTIVNDIHTGDFERIMPYLLGEIEDGNKILIPGMDNDRFDNLEAIKYLDEYHFRNVLMMAANHDECFVKAMYEFYNIIAFSNINYSSPMIQMDMKNVDWMKWYFSENNAEWYRDIVKEELPKHDNMTLNSLFYAFGRIGAKSIDFPKEFRQIINSPHYLFIDDLVRDAEEESAEKNFPEIEIIGKKIMVLHGVPIDFETKMEKGYNHYLWSGLTQGSRKKGLQNKSFDPRKAIAVLDYLEKEGYQGLIRGHDHMPTFIIKSKHPVTMTDGTKATKFNIYTKFGKFSYYVGKNWFGYQKMDDKPIYQRKLPIITDEQFIFCAGPFEDAYYGEIKPTHKGLKCKVYHASQDNAPHKKYDALKYYKKPEILGRDSLMKMHFDKEMQKKMQQFT